MKFVDEVTIEAHSGNGGAGMVHFHREKFVARGGPDGGEGGKGGSVILIANENKHTLLDFRFKPLWKAKNGAGGGIRRRNGLDGADLIISVPIGTEIYKENKEDGHEFIQDLTEHGQRYVLAAGGRGGKGNAFFKSATNQAPRHAQEGIPGTGGRFVLNLKLVADIGLVGFPNAGKSTLISKISAAKPKVADYPFTTLTPNLGVVQGKSKNFVVADIPGLIPGASEGKGLGIQFLKHIERTAALLFLIDPFYTDENGKVLSPKENYEVLAKELHNYSPELIQKKKLIAISKADAITTDEERDELKQGLPDEDKVLFISSISGEEIENLVMQLEQNLLVSKIDN